MTNAVLSINAGSSSIKFTISDATNLKPMFHGQIDGIDTAPHFSVHAEDSSNLAEQAWPAGSQTHETLLRTLLDWTEDHLQQDRLVAVGHRVVHGGSDHADPELVTSDLLSQLAALTPLAPLHQQHSLEPIYAMTRLRPSLPQVACFDTAIHRTMPPVAIRMALPRHLTADGMRRYGFHGLSYEFIAHHLRRVAPSLAAGRVIAAHLGSGASLCAMRAGKSQDTTMGFTALDGLIMGTRTGAIDPGALLYLQSRYGMDTSQLQDLLYKQSGLLGLSGISSDMRVLLVDPSEGAAQAVESFVYRAAQEIAAMVPCLGGLDGLVFTGGIGEHMPRIRALICDRLAWLGIALDPVANERGDGSIGTGPVQVMVVPANEELMIARHTLAVVSRREAPARPPARPPG